MPYTAEISRTNPSCFLFLVDQSGSMEDPFGGERRPSKADGVADAINRLLQNLVLKCAKAEGVRDYYHVGVIGYGETRSAPPSAARSPARTSLPISAVADRPARVEERTAQDRRRRRRPGRADGQVPGLVRSDRQGRHADVRRARRRRPPCVERLARPAPATASRRS